MKGMSIDGAVMEEMVYQRQQDAPPYTNTNTNNAPAVSSMEMENINIQQQLAFNPYLNMNMNTMLNQMILEEEDDNKCHWESNQDVDVDVDANANADVVVGFNHHHLNQFQQQHSSSSDFNINNYPSSSFSLAATNANPPSHLLNLFASSSSVVYDPLFHLNFPPQPPHPHLLRDLFQSLPHPHPLGYTSFYGGDTDRDNLEAAPFDNSGVLEFTSDMACLAAAKPRDMNMNGKITKHFTSERQRREHLNDKYKALRTLIPNPTKNDRASVVRDAIEYIKELLRTVNELKLLVERKRRGRERSKRLKTLPNDDQDAADISTTSDIKPLPLTDGGDQSYNGSLRCSWLQRKSKDTEVDVRIIDNQVTIKLVQRKINCLLFVSKLLDDLQLDLHHVAGGHIGDYYSYLFNTKIHEGSSVYASAIANKLIDVVDRQYAALPPI